MSQSTESDSTSPTRGVHHVGLSVRDLQRSARFFIETLGFRKVGERPEYPALFVSDGSVMLTLWQVESAESAAPPNRRRNVGLHHLALRVADGQLPRVFEAICRSPDADVEFAPQPVGRAGMQHLMCLVAGSTRLELIAAAARHDASEPELRRPA